MNNQNVSRGRATMTELDCLHGLMAEVFIAELTRCRAASVCPEPSLLGQVIKYLKDNGVDVPARAGGVDRLLGRLPDMNELEKAGVVVPLIKNG